MLVPEKPSVEPIGVLDAPDLKKQKHDDTFVSLASLSIDYNSWFDLIDNFGSSNIDDAWL